MATSFKYNARNSKGAMEEGQIYSASKASAVAELNKRGLTPVSLMDSATRKSRKGLAAMLYALPFVNRVKTQDKVIFSRQLATMVTAGVPISRALNVLEEQSDSPRMKEMALDLARQVEGGESLAKAMASHPDVISHVYVSMVRAGETGGILDDVLDRLAEQEEKDAELKSQVKSALLYPAVVSIATVLAFFFLMIVIVPKLSDTFGTLGSTLPPYTQALLNTSKFLVSWWYLVLAGVVLLIIGFRFWHRTPPGKRAVDRVALKSPILGKIIRKVNVARFARTFGSLMYAGTPLLDALEVTRSALGNSVFQDDLARIIEDVKNGSPLSEELHNSKQFPPIVGQMVAIGEETGKLSEILLQLAGFYEKEIDAIVSGLTSIIEPLLIIILGGMVGFIAVSILGPITSINNSI